MFSPPVKLVNIFDNLIKKGYCEEDMLDAFICALERHRVRADDWELPGLQERIDDLTELAVGWEGGNLEQDLDDG